MARVVRRLGRWGLTGLALLVIAGAALADERDYVFVGGSVVIDPPGGAGPKFKWALTTGIFPPATGQCTDGPPGTADANVWAAHIVNTLNSHFGYQIASVSGGYGAFTIESSKNLNLFVMPTDACDGNYAQLNLVTYGSGTPLFYDGSGGCTCTGTGTVSRTSLGSAIPTMGEWALVCMGTLVVLAGGYVLSRRRGAIPAAPG